MIYELFDLIIYVMSVEEYLQVYDDEEIPVFNIYDKVIDKKSDDVFFIRLSFRELIAYSGYWCYNRTICQEKVDELYSSLCTSYNIPFILHAIYDDKHKDPVRRLLILDGQHRREAIKKYLDINDKDWSCQNSVWICVYNLEHSESHIPQVIELFKKINNNRIFDKCELPDMFIADLVNMVCEIPHYKNNKAISTNSITNTCHSPCIHKKELNALFVKNTDIIKSKNASIQLLTSNIQIINNRLSLKSYEELYLLSQRTSEKIRYQKAVTKGFFLNLKNSKFSPETWIKFINNPNDI